jgi:hypothetical protein
MTVSEVQRLKGLEQENAQLKRLLAEAELDKSLQRHWERILRPVAEVVPAMTARRARITPATGIDGAPRMGDVPFPDSRRHGCALVIAKRSLRLSSHV